GHDNLDITAHYAQVSTRLMMTAYNHAHPHARLDGKRPERILAMLEAAAKPKFVVIAGRLHVGEPVRGERKLRRAERHVARQARGRFSTWVKSTINFMRYTLNLLSV